MILQGVLDRSLGNFVCLRGYARLGDLYQISEPDPSYQRDLITHQQERMEKFLDDGEYLFFPEVILGTSLDGGNHTESVNEFIYQFNDDKSVKFDFFQFKLNYVVTSRKSEKDSRGKVLYRRTTIDIKDKDLTANNFSKFHRIDGNHRLSILSDNLETKLSTKKIQRYKNLNVPFCLVLFNDTDKLQRFSRALFHNINYRQIALTMEQSLKQILEDTVLFSDDTLLNKFGAEYLLARKVLNSWDRSMIPNIVKVVDSENDALVTTRTFLLKTFESLAEKQLISLDENDLIEEVNRFKRQLSKINTLYEHPNLGKQRNSGLLSAFFHYTYQDSGKLTVFNNWVLENHIYQTQDTQAQEIIKIFDCVLEARKRTIFVSMQFSSETEGNYQAIKDAVDEINRSFSLELKIREIRIDQFKKGYSYKIDDELLMLINDCGLLLADITLGNKNVYHEIGYLMGLNKGTNSPQDNFILLHNKQVEGADFNADHCFNIKTYQVLLATDTNDLRQKIISQVKKFYHLD
jgi:hypothetical protein